jgi:hypothetical protein
MIDALKSWVSVGAGPLSPDVPLFKNACTPSDLLIEGTQEGD